VGMSPGTQVRPLPANGQKPDIQLSDTVHAALIKARDIATAEGRSAVTPRDIATGYVEVGGGSSGQILEVFGVSLRELLAPDGPTRNGRRPKASGRISSESVAKLFDDTGALRDDVLDEPVARAVGAALLLATAKHSAIGSHTFLQGFGLAGSEVLREALAKQGDAGQRAVQRLFTPKLNLRDLSQRSFTALEAGVDKPSDAPSGEAAVLLALLQEEGSAARQLLDKLGIDHRRLAQDLQRPGEGGTGPQLDG
jgi:Clp amino terminal domain, pathogenicity island component